MDLPNQRTILLYYQESWIGAHYIRRGIPLLKCVVLLPSRTKNIWTFFEPTAILVLWSHIQHLLSFWIQHLSDFWYYLYDSKSQKHGLEEYLLIVGSPFNTNLRFHSSRHFNLCKISAYSKQMASCYSPSLEEHNLSSSVFDFFVFWSCICVWFKLIRIQVWGWTNAIWVVFNKNDTFMTVPQNIVN